MRQSDRRLPETYLHLCSPPEMLYPISWQMIKQLHRGRRRPGKTAEQLFCLDLFWYFFASRQKSKRLAVCAIYYH